MFAIKYKRRLWDFHLQIKSKCYTDLKSYAVQKYVIKGKIPRLAEGSVNCRDYNVLVIDKSFLFRFAIQSTNKEFSDFGKKNTDYLSP